MILCNCKIAFTHFCCIIVSTVWGPEGIEAYSLGSFFSALTLLVGSFYP